MALSGETEKCGTDESTINKEKNVTLKKKKETDRSNGNLCGGLRHVEVLLRPLNLN